MVVSCGVMGGHLIASVYMIGKCQPKHVVSRRTNKEITRKISGACAVTTAVGPNPHLGGGTRIQMC